MVQNMKICLLGYRSNPYSGGQGVYLRHLSRALVREGHRVDVISGPPYPQLDPSVRLIKIESLDLYGEANQARAFRRGYLGSLTDLIEYFDTLFGGFPEPYTFGRRLVRYFKDHQPNYDIIHDNQSLSYGAVSYTHLTLPTIYSV